jgi:hypothetical protein
VIHVNDKVILLHAMEGAWGERRYSSYSFLTSAPDGGKWSASYPGCSLPLGKGPPVPTVQETGWAPELVWMQRLEENSSVSVGDQTPVIQSIVRHYIGWATTAHCDPCATCYLFLEDFIYGSIRKILHRQFWL